MLPKSFCSIHLIIFVFFVLATGCSPSQQKTDGRSKNLKSAAENLPHDPYSAKLIAATTLVKAKDFKTKLLNGETFHLAEKRGKVVVLNIWATWCPPCVEETADLVSVYEKYNDEGLIVLGVSIDNQGRSVVVPFVEKYNITYPVTIDDGTIMEKYGPVMGIPTTYIIGPKDYLRYFATGAITQKELEPRVKKLLAEADSTN